jgi:hypothetical protein
MKPSRLLTAAKKWCKFCQARDATGEPVSPFSPLAVQWDLLGAISCYTGLAVAQSEQRIRATEAWSIWCQDNSRAEYHSPETLHDFNDTTSWPWIVRALEEAQL